MGDFSVWFIIGIILLYNLLLFYIGWNGWKWLKSFGSPKRLVQNLYWLFLLFFAYSFMLGRLFDEDVIITWVGAIWLGFFYLLLFLLPVVNLIVYLSRFTSFAKRDVIKW